MPNETVVITGAFSFTGRYATRLFLDRGYRVRTLTFHPHRQNELKGKVEVFPYDFENPAHLEQSLCGASCLVNTYWVRFPKRKTTFTIAVNNTKALIAAAKRAGVKRLVHVSIANPSLHSPLAYYRGKAELEQVVKDSGLSYAILRPTVIYGPEDVLVNNIAWFVRRFPVFGIPGDGKYGIRPIHVEDMASLIATSASNNRNEVMDAVGPEIFRFEELVRLIAAQIGKQIRIIHLPRAMAYLSTLLVGQFLGDVVLTSDEYRGLMDNLLVTNGPNAGETRLTDWLSENKERVGSNYASEIARHFQRI
jgi:uncharacterized protein YbjT (DUF2867 family)